MAKTDKSIAARAVSGAAWTILTGIGSRGLGLIGTVVLTYYLSRDTLGEVSDASIVVLTANQVTVIGVGQYLIAKPKAGRDVAWHATMVHLVLGAFALAACLFITAPLAVWLKAPSLPRYLPGFVLSVAFDRLVFIPERLLARDMRFRMVGIEKTAAEITYTVASVGLAMMGVGGMAVVWANIARSALRCAIVLPVVARRDWLSPSKFSKQTMRELLSFGLPFSIGASASQASRRVDNALVSGMFGAGTVGVYNLAYNVADVPAVQVGEQIGDVLLPSFAHMDHEQRKAALVRSTGLLGLIVFPLAVGLGVISPTVVRAVLRPEWRDVGPMLTVLSALSVTRPVGWTISSYLQARDRPGTVMKLEIFKLAAVVGFILLLGQWGPLWACAAVGVAFTAHAIASIWVVHRLDDTPFWSLLGKGVPPLVACIPMVVAVLAARAAMQHLGFDQRFVELALELLVGAAVYIAAALVFARATSKDFLNLVRGVLRRRRASPA
jgi:PST family polysaccharide transporter